MSESIPRLDAIERMRSRATASRAERNAWFCDRVATLTASGLDEPDAWARALAEWVPSSYQDPVSPGEILREEFLVHVANPSATEPLQTAVEDLAHATCLAEDYLWRVLRDTARLDEDAAVRLALALGTTAEFWLGLQSSYILERWLAANLEVLVEVRPLKLQPE